METIILLVGVGFICFAILEPKSVEVIRREVATAALQGILAGSTSCEDGSGEEPEEIVAEAVEYADLLLAKLGGDDGAAD